MYPDSCTHCCSKIESKGEDRPPFTFKIIYLMIHHFGPCLYFVSLTPTELWNCIFMHSCLIVCVSHLSSDSKSLLVSLQRPMEIWSFMPPLLTPSTTSSPSERLLPNREYICEHNGKNMKSVLTIRKLSRELHWNSNWKSVQSNFLSLRLGSFSYCTKIVMWIPLLELAP